VLTVIHGVEQRQIPDGNQSARSRQPHRHERPEIEYGERPRLDVTVTVLK
jgi:hypothetical protein